MHTARVSGRARIIQRREWQLRAKLRMGRDSGQWIIVIAFLYCSDCTRVQRTMSLQLSMSVQITTIVQRTTSLQCTKSIQLTTSVEQFAVHSNPSNFNMQRLCTRYSVHTTPYTKFHFHNRIYWWKGRVCAMCTVSIRVWARNLPYIPVVTSHGWINEL